MGSYDRTEICDLVRGFLLGKLSSIIHVKNIGLYRDNGLAVIGKVPGPEMEGTKKKLIAVFKRHRLKVTADIYLF